MLDLNVVLFWLHGGELFELTVCHVPKFVANLDCLISKYGVSQVGVSRGSSVIVVTKLWAIPPRNRGLIPGRCKRFLYLKASRPTLVPDQPLVQWALESLSLGAGDNANGV